MALSEEALRRLEPWIAQAFAAERVEVIGCERLAGGAIQENLGLDLEVIGGPRAGRHALVLRTDAPSTLGVSWNRAQEFHLLRAAHAAGVTVPKPWHLCDDPAVLGRSFYLMQRMYGEARGARLVRDAKVQAEGEALVTRLAQDLARLHAVCPPQPGLDFIPLPSPDPARHRIAEYRHQLDVLEVAEPVLEWALAWLERMAPPEDRVCLVHADYRTGNYLVQDGELQAILDWEFAAFSDPYEDLGWMLMRYWRFGNDEREAGGVGSRQAFLTAYATATGMPVDEARVDYWQIMGVVRWAVIALMQAARYYRDGEASLELALTGHVLPPLELDLITGIEAFEGRWS